MPTTSQSSLLKRRIDSLIAAGVIGFLATPVAFLAPATSAAKAAGDQGVKAAGAQGSKAKAPRILAAAYLKAHGDRDVGYDAGDKRFYSVAYAKTHGMRDKGGDPMTVRRLSSLPADAAMSRAMHGKL